ncbi:MAG: hypothetical protein WCK31_01745 [bacterium]
MAEEKVVEAKPVAAANNDLLIKALVMYGLPILGGLFYMNATDSFIKFNSKQSIYYGIALYVIGAVLSVVTFGCGSIIPAIAYIVVLIYMVMKMKDGVKVKLPVIGDMAEK